MLHALNAEHEARKQQKPILKHMVQLDQDQNQTADKATKLRADARAMMQPNLVISNLPI